MPSPEVQRIALGGAASATSASAFILMKAPYQCTWTITYAGHTTGDLTWDASEDDVRRALELLKGVGRVHVMSLRRHAGSLGRSNSWTRRRRSTRVWRR